MRTFDLLDELLRLHPLANDISYNTCTFLTMISVYLKALGLYVNLLPFKITKMTLGFVHKNTLKCVKHMQTFFLNKNINIFCHRPTCQMVIFCKITYVICKFQGRTA